MYVLVPLQDAHVWSSQQRTLPYVHWHWPTSYKSLGYLLGWSMSLHVAETMFRRWATSCAPAPRFLFSHSQARNHESINDAAFNLCQS